MNTGVKSQFHNSLFIKTYGNYLTVYQVVCFCWLGGNNLASSLLITQMLRMVIAHCPVTVSIFTMPLLFQICTSVFSPSVAKLAHVHELALRRKTNHSRLVLEDKDNKWFPYLIFLKQKPFMETQPKAHWLKWICADSSAQDMYSEGWTLLYPLTINVSGI